MTKITLEKLAVMIQKGFEETATKVELKEVKQDVSALKQDVSELKKDMSEVKQDVKWMKDNSSELFTKLDKFIALYEKHEQELLLFGEQMRRYDKWIKQIAEKVGVKLDINL